LSCEGGKFDELSKRKKSVIRKNVAVHYQRLKIFYSFPSFASMIFMRKRIMLSYQILSFTI